MVPAADSDKQSSGQAVKRIVAEMRKRARSRGYVTADDVFAVLTDEQAQDDQMIDEVYAQLAEGGIELRDLEEEPGQLDLEEVLTDHGGRSAPLELGDEDSDDTISLYLKEIGSIPLLTAEDERQLAACYERGRSAQASLPADGGRDSLPSAELADLERQIREGERARGRLTHANTRLVVHLAKKYVNHGVPLMDLIQEGNLGLIRAVEKFDYRRGFKFSTYATWWIRQAITRALADQARTIRVPVHMSEQIAKINAVTRRLEQELGRRPTNEEIGHEVGMSPKRVERVLEIAQRPLSLEMKVGEDADSELGDFLPDEGSPEPTERAGQELLREEIESVLGSLTRREAQVLELRFGLVDGRSHTLEEVGEKFGVTRERIRQIETKAIRRLRHPTRSKKLRDYLR